MLSKTTVNRITRDTLITEIAAVKPLMGGDINEVWHLLAPEGNFVLKIPKGSTPNDLYPAETAGLNAIATTHAISIPCIQQTETDYLLMDYVPTATPEKAFWQYFGEQLASMHQHPAPHFGFSCHTYCGLTPQYNPPMDSGHSFFWLHRLKPLGQMAQTLGYFTEKDAKQLERLSERLIDLIPEQKASLIHGDLWSGNVLCRADQQPVLIDPACYWGWPEAELAMTTLFGCFDKTFYDAYEANAPGLEADWRERTDIYNLYHLLNHLVMFGQAYYDDVTRILNRYA